MRQSTLFNRRRFAQLIGAGAAYALAKPGISFSQPMLRGIAPATLAADTVVRLSSNENPYGPSPMALKAMTEAFNLAWRYPDEHTNMLVEMLAKLNHVNRDQFYWETARERS